MSIQKITPAWTVTAQNSKSKESLPQCKWHSMTDSFQLSFKKSAENGPKDKLKDKIENDVTTGLNKEDITAILSTIETANQRKLASKLLGKLNEIKKKDTKKEKSLFDLKQIAKNVKNEKQAEKIAEFSQSLYEIKNNKNENIFTSYDVFQLAAKVVNNEELSETVLDLAKRLLSINDSKGDTRLNGFAIKEICDNVKTKEQAEIMFNAAERLSDLKKANHSYLLTPFDIGFSIKAIETQFQADFAEKLVQLKSKDGKNNLDTVDVKILISKTPSAKDEAAALKLAEKVLEEDSSAIIQMHQVKPMKKKK